MFESPFDFNWYYRVSSYYGYRIHPISGANALHNGVDIGAAEGTPIAAGLTGTVITSTYNDSYGNYVAIKDDKGYEIRYAHLSSRSVSAGQHIEKGEEVGKVGSTGNSTGPHLHLELFHNGERLNPIFYFETGDAIPGVGDVEYSSEAARRLVEFSLEKLVTDAAGHAESGLYEIATYKNGEFGDPIKYYLVETKALDGYTLDSTQHEIVFEYVDQNTPVIEVTKDLTNKEAEPGQPGNPGNLGSNPKTGDETNLWLPIVLMIGAASMIAGILFGSKKKKKLNKKED